jgi:hypothetical protein
LQLKNPDTADELPDFQQLADVGGMAPSTIRDGLRQMLPYLAMVSCAEDWGCTWGSRTSYLCPVGACVCVRCWYRCMLPACMQPAVLASPLSLLAIITLTPLAVTCDMVRSS